MISDSTLLALAERNRRRRERKQAATVGPWVAARRYEIEPRDAFHILERGGCRVARLGDHRLEGWHDANASFIAGARNDPVEDDIDLLLAEVRRLRGE
jgi:hypothetical protein